MKTTILVIEDNEEICENIAGILKIGGYDVLTAFDGKSGVEKALKHKPNLVLCDIMMPELDGYGVLHVLSRHPDTADIPFIFLTAKAEKSDFRKGMGLGADDYLVKPFDGMELLDTVAIRLKKSEQLKTSFGTQLDDIDAFLENAGRLPDLLGISAERPRKSYKKRDHIFMEGQWPNELYYIIRGEVKTSRINPDGKELVTGMFREGQFIGYVPLLKDTPYTDSAVALQDTEVGVIPKHDFQTLIHTNREIASRFIKILSNNLFENEKRLLELAYQSVRQRVASALTYLYRQQGIADKAMPLLTVSRKDIAAIVGTALESLNRTLADFRDEHLISLTDGGIKILEIGKLERISR
ncbi:transcriptional regulator [Parapedobacter defluvii]|uniref:Transcriptional regulator n=1 Tax=Parapedobacter defluvii TaxID=2045106 RepID=A0ABQ1M474_9SPHI|nr:response regulator [Parapedobacter defluvii]GGC33094.1 transcriptional regulator [Parapedobacter defluvii]